MVCFRRLPLIRHACRDFVGSARGEVESCGPVSRVTLAGPLAATCSTHHGNVLLYSDAGHITVRTSKAFAQMFAGAISQASVSRS
jgi:hypothetical protein